MTEEKVFDVDAYLQEKGVIIKLGKKNFTVTDIPFEAQKLMKNSEEDGQKKALQLILGCKEADLESYGMAATGHIIRHITENLFQEPSLKEA